MAGVYRVSLMRANNLVTNYRVANDPLSWAEDHHAAITSVAKTILGPGSGPVTDRGWNLTPPPGNENPLRVGATGTPSDPSAAHHIVNVLNLMVPNPYGW
jgi:hypothetical protein